MRILLALLLIATTACVRGSAAAQAPGTWELTRINGETLPQPWPAGGTILIAAMTWEEFRWTLQGGRPRVIDEEDDEYRFARRTAATRGGARTDSGRGPATSGWGP